MHLQVSACVGFVKQVRSVDASLFLYIGSMLKKGEGRVPYHLRLHYRPNIEVTSANVNQLNRSKMRDKGVMFQGCRVRIIPSIDVMYLGTSDVLSIRSQQH